MQLSTFLLFPLLALAVAAPGAEPTPDALAVPEAGPEDIGVGISIARRDAAPQGITPHDANGGEFCTCTALAPGCIPRLCPMISCPSYTGVVKVGTRVTFTCYKVGDKVFGSNLWAKYNGQYYPAAYWGDCTNKVAAVELGAFGDWVTVGRRETGNTKT
ncbi:hypothetical protein K440DRAFT_642772 [Wilcoxina mikolae CBS 423.85]|nr:hypothetical protein K440DRAFT_642772 [Wilcoxina mikolae CBS 423.85]